MTQKVHPLEQDKTGYKLTEAKYLGKEPKTPLFQAVTQACYQKLKTKEGNGNHRQTSRSTQTLQSHCLRTGF
jgi:hypothetical protein